MSAEAAERSSSSGGGRLLAAGAAEVVFVGRGRVRDEIAAHGLIVKEMDGRAETVAAWPTWSGERSPFVHTSRTSTPPARASATKRSSLRRLRSRSSEVVTRHLSLIHI